jgi:glutathione S-transferase
VIEPVWTRLDAKERIPRSLDRARPRQTEDHRMKLYYAPQTRSIRPRWLLEEIGAPYELVTMSLKSGDHKKPAYLKVHPHGVVPALEDGDVKLFESGAICAYLADKFPDKKLAPAPGTKERGYYYQWLFYAMATMEPPVLRVFLNTVMLPEAQRKPSEVEEGKKQWAEVAKVLSAALEGKEYLVGNQFSAADIMVGSIAGWSSFMGLLEGFPVLQEYAGRLSARPAFQRANG